MSAPSSAVLRASSALSGVPLAWRPPFGLGAAYVDCRPAGETIAQMVASVPGLPERFAAHGVVCVNGVPVPRDLWRHVRPKVSLIERPVAVTLHLAAAGGGDGGSAVKSVVGIVAAIALTALTGGIAGGLLATSSGLFAAGSLSANLLAGAVGLAGALAISALTAPPVRTAEAGDRADAAEAASASGNVIEPGGAVPRVIGTRKVYPPLAGEPYVELIGQDEYVHLVAVLNGPHALAAPRIGDTAIEDAEDVEYELREGWESDDRIELVTRQAKTVTPQLELSAHTVDPESQGNLLHPDTPARDLPVWHQVATRSAPDEVWMHLLMPEGLAKRDDVSNDKAIPLRIQARLRGGSVWRNFPEIHVSERTLNQLRKALIFHFDLVDEPSAVPAVPATSGFYYARITVPGQAVPDTAGWTADAYFNAGAGAAYLARGNEASSAVAHTYLYDNRAEFFLDPASWTAGVYEFRIMRGCAYDASSLTKSNYQYSGTVRDFFSYYLSGSTPVIPMSRQDIAERVYLNRVISVWDEHPLPLPGFAAIAVRARNRSVDTVSVEASGYVRDWDGTGWTDWTTTSNPAPHYRDILAGRLNLDPLPDDLIDEDGLVAWRQDCIDHDWTCDALIEEERTQDALTLVASCGYARPYQSEIYGVVVDRDQTGEPPVQVFTPVNAVFGAWKKAFPQLPNGFLVRYRDRADDYNEAQMHVYAPGYEGGDEGRFEVVSYEGLVDADKVRARALFDLAQAVERSTIYPVSAPAEALVCRRGDLVGTQHDVIDRQAGYAYVRRVRIAGGAIVGLDLEAEIPVVNEPDMLAVADMLAVPDMLDLGITTGVAIRRSDGSVTTHALSDATGSRSAITFAAPIDDEIDTIEALDDTDGRYGALVTSGPIGRVYRRLKVQDMRPASSGEGGGADLVFDLSLVDEAPALVRG